MWGMQHVVQEGACTTWSRRGRAPTMGGLAKDFDWSFCPSGWLAIGLARFTVYMNVLLMSKQKESFQKKGQNDQHLVLALIVGSVALITGLEDWGDD